MSTKNLARYGLRRIAQVKIVADRFIIALDDEGDALLAQERCIYAFAIGDEIVRIGSSKDQLRVRLRRWQGDVTKALQGKKSATTPKEAAGWRASLDGKNPGVLYARIGSLVRSPVGSFNAYLSEESELIGRYLPEFNNSKHR